MPDRASSIDVASTEQQAGAVPRCPACSSALKDGRLAFVLDDSKWPLKIYRCACGLHYSDYAVRQVAGDIYDAPYYDHPRYVNAAGRRAYVAHLAGFLTESIGMPPVSSQRRRLLDVGCATGDFVEWALQAGWDAEGVDTSPEAVEIGRRVGLPLRQASIEQASPAGPSYDVVTLWDVLEHLPRPLEALRSAQRILRPGGTLLLKTATCTSLVDQLARGGYRLSFGKLQAPLKRMYVVGHLYYFTCDTLRRVLCNAGWTAKLLRQTDTPPASLSHSRPLQAAFTVLWALQRWTGRCYELMAACQRSQRGRPEP